jgi:ubiquinone/menaquinone biosynthesis C-methylase UbiE
MTKQTTRTYQNSPELVREVNRLWLTVYETLARQVAEACSKPPERILEVGCFSGGVGLTLQKHFPLAILSIALDMPELAASFHKDWKITDTSRLEIVETPIDHLSLPDESFDLVFCRGGFFFLDNEGTLLRDIDRVIAPGGVAFFGGGYGIHTPDSVITPIADESRIKNKDLGRRIYSKSELQALLEKTNLLSQSDIIESGGLWILIRKTGYPN